MSGVVKRILMALALPRQTAPMTDGVGTGIVQVGHQVSQELHDVMPLVQTYGFASAPLVGCDHVAGYAEGDRTKGVSIATNDQRFRPKGLAGGESQQHDASGQFVYLTIAGGTPKIVVNGKVEIDFQINGVLVGKFTAAGLAVIGAITATGDITAGLGTGNTETLLTHTHNYNPGDGEPTATTPPMVG